MIVTEKEAAQKWCPFARVITTVDGEPTIDACNRVCEIETVNGIAAGVNRIGPANCVGSACMAWKFTTYTEKSNGGAKLGYCALAGRAFPK